MYTTLYYPIIHFKGKFSMDIYLDHCKEIIRTSKGIEVFQRHFYPPAVTHLKEKIGLFNESIVHSSQLFFSHESKNSDNATFTLLKTTTELLLQSLDLILKSDEINFNTFIADILKAFRYFCRSQEILFSLRDSFTLINEYFLEPDSSDKYEQYHSDKQKIHTGLHHIDYKKDPYERGILSYYIPEFSDSSKPLPLVIALHGGFSHGRDFIWTWLREARSRNFILAAPTSIGATWSILDPHIDIAQIIKAIDLIDIKCTIDKKKILLTGISDGGTFAQACAMEETTPFTAFAPIAATLPSFNFQHIKNRKIFWIHGNLDWMFPVYKAKQNIEVLQRNGTDIEFKIIKDLSHTYPREENKNLLEWFTNSS